MNGLKFNLKDIRKKVKYITEQLKKNDLDVLEKEKLQCSLVAYFGILNSSGSFIDTILPNFLDKATKGRYSAHRDLKRMCNTGEIVFSPDSFGFMTNDFLSLLIELSKIIQKPQLEETKFGGLKISDLELKNIALDFYNKLDSDIFLKVEKMFLGPNLINVSENVGQINKLYSGIACGITYYDYVYHVSYCSTIKEGTFRDMQVFVHELMHAVDFFMCPKILSKNYYGFHETAPYCIDLLFADYLEKNGYSKEEANKIRSERIHYIRGLASQVLYQIKEKLNHVSLDECSIDEIYSVINENILKELLEIQSGVMAIGLYNQIKQNYEIGISNLKVFMKELIPKDRIPDFSNIGLNNYELLEICKKIRSMDDVLLDMQLDSFRK